MSQAFPSSPAAFAGQQRLAGWCIGAIVGVGLVAFAGSLRGQFVFDDFNLLIFDARFQQLWPWGPLEHWHRALVDWTFQANYALGGRNVLGYHLVNLAIHLLAALTLFGLARRSLQLPGIAPALATRAEPIALAIALIWLVHPLQTEAVTYVVQRYESLLGLCFLLTLYCTVRGSQAARGWVWYCGAIAAAWAAAASKEVAAAIPLVLLAFDRAFLAGSWSGALRQRWGLYLAIVPSLGWMLWALRHTFHAAAATGGAGFGLVGLSPWEYLRSQPAAILTYLQLAFWPRELILDRGWMVASSPLQIYGLGLVVLGLVAASLWGMWRLPRLGFLGLSFFLILAPTSTIVPIADLAVEHRMYLPLAPLTALVVLAAVALLDRWPLAEPMRWRVATAVLAIVVLALSARTIWRNADYAQPRRLWEQVIKYNPAHARGYRNLASYAIQAGDYPAAERLFRAALACQPKHPRNWLELGNLRFRQQQLAGAIECYERALALDPRASRPWQNISTCRLVRRDHAGALAAARQAISLAPQEAEPRKQAAWLLGTAPDDAVRDGREALRILAPLAGTASEHDLQYLEILAAAQAESGQFDLAARTARRAHSLATSRRSPRAAEFQRLIARYQAKLPFRSQPPSAEEVAAAAKTADGGT
ncbi:MAG: tetratricopeptide repeat protein [Pirellulaceae bacterium]|nr:tetratricopeptide repeat protein [Pirellulaceae bacterium]